ncbi:hypothetical protein PRIPAC_90866 [Pristionchus pacificus]|uniref:Uncharacterized protein n=1 Tax=Pristionchus pacificus TaxID=54126 RepID=A0A2A6B8W6_PRIPA|nr:hypothetical protein PRIPAC_90866 [Pristionchus pacificus]|eukprot:PDM62307.1 hypothetical protein PRIPAC_51749 [Pristionchus pacificus]
MLLEIVDNVSDNLKNNEASSDSDKSMDKKDCDMKKTVQNIRYIAKKYIDTHEIENKYWKNGLISKQLELISEGFNHASTPSIITKSIEDFLSKILTRDQFVIIVTNLCLQHSFSDVNIKKMGVYTVVVMRSTLFKRKPFQWLQMEQDVSSMNLMFNCNEKFYKQNDQYSFERGIKGVHATSAAIRVQTSVVNVNKAVSKGTPGWWITGNEYANYFKSDQLKTLVMNSVKNSILVLCF